MRRFIALLFLIGSVSAALLIASTAAHASMTPPHKVFHVRLAPPVPCTSKNRMDMFVDEDGIMYECQCEMLVTMASCHWQVIGGTDEVELRKRFRRLYHMAIPRGWLFNGRVLWTLK